MIDDVIREVAQAIEGGGWMELNGYAGAEVDVLPDSLTLAA